MTKKSEVTKSKILDAALGLFRQRGFASTTMREIADAAGVATGASYYHFSTKDEIVMHFYGVLAEDFTEACRKIAAQTDDLWQRLEKAMQFRFTQLAPYRESLPILVRNAVDPSSPLSAFSRETSEMRDAAVRAFTILIEGSGVNFPSVVRSELPFLLWLWHMMGLYFWLLDESPAQASSSKMLKTSIGLMPNGLHLLAFPGAADLVRPFFELLRQLDPRPANK